MADMIKHPEFIKMFDGYDTTRLPNADFEWAAKGGGGDAVLLFGSEKTALFDTGMAYIAEEVIENIKKILAAHGREKVDYVFVSHTHYDHIGALPYVLDEWLDAVVYGSAKAQYVFTRPGALNFIKEMGIEAAKEFGRDDLVDKVKTEGLRVDQVLADGDTVSLGNYTITAMETKGHTDCCMSYGVDPGKILFASESSGVVVPQLGVTGSEILKSTQDALDACDKCEAYGPAEIICPHYGSIPTDYIPHYFETMREDAQMKKDFIAAKNAEGLDADQILEAYADWLYVPGEQPKAAFMANAVNIVNVMLWEVQNEQ